MTLLFFNGLEMRDLDIDPAWSQSFTNWETGASTRFNYGSSWYGSMIGRTFPATAQPYIGFAAKQDASAGLQIDLYGDAGATNHARIVIGTDGSIVASRAGTALQTLGAGTVNQLVWHYYEITATINDSTGIIQMRIDGNTTPVINVSAADTKNGGTNTTFDLITWNHIGNSFHIDDIYILDTNGSANNTWLGDVRVYTLAPNGNGNYSQFVGSDADSTNNYQLVDEQPYATADYVGSATSGNRDSYAMTDLPASVSTVYAVQEVAVVAKSDSGAQTIKQMVRVNSTDYETSAITLSTSYVAVRNLREQNPNTSAAWTAAGVNGTEAGVRVG